MSNNRTEMFILSKLKAAQSGVITDADHKEFFDAVREVACAPLWRSARRESGLAKFERESRRCVHPGGVHPKLAYTVEGTPEYDEHKVLSERAQGIFQRLRIKCGY